MSKVINDNLDATKLSQDFMNANPFHHVVIDNFLNVELANKIKENFPNPDDKSWWVYNNPLEKKLAFNKIEELHDSFSTFFSYANSNEFLNWLQDLTGLKSLKADPDLNGGGLHLIRQGGKLDIHEDFNIHKELKMLRKVNLIFYLNEEWDESWGGHLELWNKDMTELCQKITPKFNRAVIFRTDMDSNHGHPHPLSCPENRYRISLATYYYIEDANIDKIEYRSTKYKKLPGTDDGLDGLRILRSKGRLENLTTKS